MLVASGCCVPPPRPPTRAAPSRSGNVDAAAIPTRPAATQMFPPISSQNSPARSPRYPAGTCSAAEAPLDTERSRPAWVYESRSWGSDWMSGSRGTVMAKNRSLHT